MPIILPDYFTLETIMIFILFVIVIFVIYRMLKLIFKAAIIGIASFSFPWIIEILKLPLPITANIDTGIYFAITGVSIFLIYESISYIIYFFKIVTWPIRVIMKKRKD